MNHSEIPNSCPPPRDTEITRLRTALEQIRDHCANSGRGNPAVDERIVDRCEETARDALEGAGT